MQAREVQIPVDLLGLELGTAGLHLNQTAPYRLATLNDNRAVRNVNLPRLILELDLGERRDASFGRSQRRQQRMTKLGDGMDHSQQRGRRALLLFVLPADPHRRDQPRRAPPIRHIAAQHEQRP